MHQLDKEWSLFTDQWSIFDKINVSGERVKNSVFVRLFLVILMQAK